MLEKLFWYYTPPYKRSGDKLDRRPIFEPNWSGESTFLAISLKNGCVFTVIIFYNSQPPEIFDSYIFTTSHIQYFNIIIICWNPFQRKSTQIPQYLHEAGWTSSGYQVCVTQPRRVAAVTLAVRVADEKGSMIGSTIGYAVRFDSKQDEQQTRVKFVTDGVLLQEMTSDPLLRRYSVIMIDEAHERSLQTDMCLGLLKTPFFL